MSLTADVRAMLPDLDGYAYFQTSGFSPKLNPVVDEVVHWLKFQSRGPALPFVTRQIEELKRDIRGKVARTVNATPEEIVMTENTTIGINIVANGIDWKPGDNVLLTNHEHPGNRLTWYNLTGRYDVELRFAPMYNDLGRTLEEMDRLIDGRTRLVSVSHVSRRTGLRLPGRAVCDLAHGKDTPVLFDGAQSFGAIPIDVRELDCDFYSFCGHKYTMAPQGTGGLFIRKDRIDWLKPSWIGSHSQKTFDQEGNMDLHDEARRFEFATRSVPDQAGFGKALDIWEGLGWEAIFAGIAAYTDRMKAALLEIPELVLETPASYDDSSGIVTFHVPGLEAGPLSESLQQHEKVLVSPLEFAAESTRVSTHVFNSDEDLERLTSGIRRVQREGLEASN
ncbi:MAG: aminotransferase class V-fold PLP-dependent enzyme [Gemmatimonadetes bacterium]|nr:aminotransferase class V-fold PLP-dependent enzyme [Gemmatimonadota bacterium]